MYGDLLKPVLCNLRNVECAEQTAEEGDNGVPQQEMVLAPSMHRLDTKSYVGT